MSPEEREMREEWQAEDRADARATEWINPAAEEFHGDRNQARYERGMGW